MAGETLERHSFKMAQVFSSPFKCLDSQKEALHAGDALQIGQYLLDLHQTFSEAGHGEDGQLITRIYRQNRQEPPAASGSIWCRLGDGKHF